MKSVFDLCSSGIEPRENVVAAMMTFGEGWHNYHHAFPWDYRAAELGYFRYNFSTRFIDMCARMGWAYDLKSVPLDMVQHRANRKGDGSYSNPYAHSVWGWGDKDMTVEEKIGSVIMHEKKTKAK